jgi:glycosyltransferase involved in cell wall biosynthesis
VSTRTCRVSVCLPVFNGEQFIAEALDSILSQTFRDIEIIISDNGSQDRTQAICQSYADKDDRISYYRAVKNRGPAWNFNTSYEKATGEYLKWTAHDDLCEPDFLERAVAVLDAEPDVVLCHAKWARIDENKAVIEHLEKLPDYEQARASDRFGSLIHMDQRHHSGVEIFGLIRMSALKAINQPPIGNFAHGDRLTLAALSLMGRFHRLPEPLLLNRTHAGRSMVFDPKRTWRGHTRVGQWLGIGPIPPDEWFDPVWEGRITFPDWRILWQYWRALTPASLPPMERLRCGAHIGRRAIASAPKLLRDVLIAGEQSLGGFPEELERKRAISEASAGKP